MVLTPFQAVIWAAVFNFISAFSFGTGVARTVGEGMVSLDFVTPYVILAGLIGAIVWDLFTWWRGLPTSSSHALFGGYAGAAMARSVILNHRALEPIIWSGWIKTLVFMVLAPLIGLVAAVFSFAHGTNDAQKTMGIVTGVLFTARYIPVFRVPVWVILSASAAIGLGTMSGGWRIVHAMGGRITRLKPRSGFCAETAGAISILAATALGVGVSTTHVITGAIAGVGSIQRVKAVRWGVASNIMWAWFLTIAAAATVAWITYWTIHGGGWDAR